MQALSWLACGLFSHQTPVAADGIPGVLGVGNGTKRIAHGQTITIDGDVGVVMIHDDDGEFRASGDADLGPVSPHVRA